MEEKKCIQYVDNYSFYRIYGNFDVQNILLHFSELIEPYFRKQINVRTWAHVEWSDEHDFFNKIEEHENSADCLINKMGLISVCAYNSSKINAKIQTEMMKNHEYLMTNL